MDSVKKNFISLRENCFSYFYRNKSDCRSKTNLLKCLNQGVMAGVWVAGGVSGSSSRKEKCNIPFKNNRQSNLYF
jgi:hypothetical protein